MSMRSTLAIALYLGAFSGLSAPSRIEDAAKDTSPGIFGSALFPAPDPLTPFPAVSQVLPRLTPSPLPSASAKPTAPSIPAQGDCTWDEDLESGQEAEEDFGYDTGPEFEL